MGGGVGVRGGGVRVRGGRMKGQYMETSEQPRQTIRPKREKNEVNKKKLFQQNSTDHL